MNWCPDCKLYWGTKMESFVYSAIVLRCPNCEEKIGIWSELKKQGELITNIKKEFADLQKDYGLHT